MTLTALGKARELRGLQSCPTWRRCGQQGVRREEVGRATAGVLGFCWASLCSVLCYAFREHGTSPVTLSGKGVLNAGRVAVCMDAGT